MGVDDKGKAHPIYVNCSFCLLDLLLYMDDDSIYQVQGCKVEREIVSWVRYCLAMGGDKANGKVFMMSLAIKSAMMLYILYERL